MKLKEQIKKILQENIDCRNSDTELLIKYLESLGIYLTKEQKKQFRDNKIGSKDINRARRSLRHEFPYLEATEEIVKARRVKEFEYRQEYSTNKAFAGIFGNVKEKLNNLLK